MIFVGTTNGVWLSKNAGDDWEKIESATMPINVMPICTVERNRVGLSESSSATPAPLEPEAARCCRRALRAEMIASSDMAKNPFSKSKAKTNATSVAIMASTVTRVLLSS